MNQSSINTTKINPYRELYEKQRREDKLYYCRKLAEIDYMLFTIEKSEIPRQAEIYELQVVSDLRTLLSKRLMTFAAAEEHRDYGLKFINAGNKKLK